MSILSQGAGFLSAQTDYGQLKAKFLDFVSTTAGQIQKEEIKKEFNELQQESIGGRGQEFKKVNQFLDNADFKKAIETLIIPGFDTEKYKNQIENLEKNFQGTQEELIKERKKIEDEITTVIKNYLQSSDEITILHDIQKHILEQSSGVTLDAVKDQYLRYITRLYQQRIGLLKTSVGLNQAAIAGYYQEATESRLITELLKKIKLKGVQAGTILSEETKKQTPLDIVIGHKNTSNKALQHLGTSIYDKLTKQIRTMAAESIVVSVEEASINWEDFFSKIEKINAVGIQSKLYTLNFSSEKIKPDGYKIGSRENLFKNFYKEKEKIYKTYGESREQYMAAIFFNLSQTAIIEAFGPSTLIFRTGSQRFFMDELIIRIQQENASITFLEHKNQLMNTVVIKKL